MSYSVGGHIVHLNDAWNKEFTPSDQIILWPFLEQNRRHLLFQSTPGCVHFVKFKLRSGMSPLVCADALELLEQIEKVYYSETKLLW